MIKLLRMLLVFVLALIFIFSASVASVTHAQETSVGVTALLGNHQIENNVGAITTQASRLGINLDNRTLYSEVVSTTSTLLNSSFLNNYNNRNLTTNFQWGISYNFSDSNLSVYVRLVSVHNGTIMELEWGASNQGWLAKSANVSFFHETYQYTSTSTNWSGWEFYDPSHEAISYVYAETPVSTIESPPTGQNPNNNYESDATWDSLAPGPGGNGNGVTGLAQTWYERNYFGNLFEGPSWGPYYIWYEDYPAASYNYPGAPNLNPGWDINFYVFYGNPGFEFEAYIYNTSTEYAVSTSSSDPTFVPYYIEFITEAPTITQDLKTWIVQIPEFSESEFLSSGYFLQNSAGSSLWTLYTTGYYNQYTLLQNSNNDYNTQEGWISDNGNYPEVTWSNSYYNWTYVNG
jgi:hypothetical protein